METPDSSEDKKPGKCNIMEKTEATATPCQNGDVEMPDHYKAEFVTSTCSPQENGDVPKKGKFY